MPRWIMPVVVVVLALALVSGFVVLSLNGRDTGAFVLFLASPLVTSIVGVLLTARVKEVASAVNTVTAQLPLAVAALAGAAPLADNTAAATTSRTRPTTTDAARIKDTFNPAAAGTEVDPYT